MLRLFRRCRSVFLQQVVEDAIALRGSVRLDDRYGRRRWRSPLAPIDSDPRPSYFELKAADYRT